MLGEHSKGSKPFQGRFLAGAFSKYDEPSLPPIWYCNFSDVDVKKAVAHSFGLPQYLYLETWTKCIAVLRNLCAHHDRIWNKRFPWKPQLPKRLPLAWIDTRSLRPIKLYAQLCCLAYLEQSIHPKSDFKEKVIALLYDKSQTITKAMGFPANWQEEPLWKA